jgi:hypothetical protein
VRKLYRFVPYTARRDDTAEVAFTAVCVTGEDEDCGAASGNLGDEDAVTKWMAEHFRDTEHPRFQRTASDYALVTRDE